MVFFTKIWILHQAPSPHPHPQLLNVSLLPKDIRFIGSAPQALNLQLGEDGNNGIGVSSFPKLAKTTIAFDPLAGNSEIGQEHPEGNIKKKNSSGTR